MDMPAVTVIMNCLNGERYLREALDSVYSQTYRNWNIIFWDNASTDSTARIAKSYNSQLEYYRSELTTDLGLARVKASKLAKGELLAFLDCDDLWDETKLEKQVEIFCNGTEDLGVVYGRTKGRYELDNRKDKIFYEGQILPEGRVYSKLVKQNFIAFSSAMVDRRKFFEAGGFPSHFKNSTDYWVFLRMAKRYEFKALQEVCCYYRIHGTNLSAEHNILAIQESITAVSQFLPDKDAQAGLKHQYLQLALMHVKEKKILTAIWIILRERILLMLIVWTLKRVGLY